jgi:hypothetical protein
MQVDELMLNVIVTKVSVKFAPDAKVTAVKRIHRQLTQEPLRHVLLLPHDRPA